MRELRKYDLDIACLSEVRMPNTGYSVIKAPDDDTCYHMHHTGVVDNSGMHGVAIALDEAVKTATLAWAPISPNLANTCLKGVTMKLTVVAVYAPTLDAGEEAKDSFYAEYLGAAFWGKCTAGTYV